jgi:serine phosphatase RsbU (regulator of sigma subunit)
MAGSGNNLCIGTSYGLSVYNLKENTFSHYAEKDGIANSFVYEIQEDIESSIWVSTNKGLSKFDPVSGSFRNFSRNEGLQANEFNRGASFATSDGELLFGGVSGLNSFYPDEMPENPVVPSVSITNFEIIDASGLKSIPLGKNTSFVKVRYNQSFKVDFSALDFSYPISNRYMYSLEELGRPEKWIMLGEERTVTISNLPSGEYTLRVKGSNNDGVWNPRGVSLRILVEAPFWRTRIAMITFILLIIISFYFIIQYRTQSLRQTNRILKERDLAGQEVSRQKELLSKRNKNIEDSLKYAHRIQSAMLTTQEQFKAHLPDSFILHKPKDIISGDFFWLSEVDDYIFVAAVDCTGHGVPGAFMSVIGFELFRKIINMQEVRDPGKILNHLNQNFQEIFSSGNDISLRDGMDLAFCVLNKKERLLKFAGAFSPLYLVRNDKLIEIKGDRFSVGADNDPSEGLTKKSFTSHELKLEKEDMIYLFTDGYADQFGGPEGKKYKYRRFRHLLLTIHQLPLHRQKAFLDESIEEWRGNYEQIDDILVIGIQPGF